MSTTQNALVSVSYAAVSGFPAGSVVDHILVTATASNPANSPPSKSVAPNTASVTFTNLTPDTYTLTAQGFPASGAGYGTAVSTTITITSTAPISLQLPSSITVTQP
jgi:hypothetical protein